MAKAAKLDSLTDMKEEVRARGESLLSDAQAEVVGYLDFIREALSSRLDGIDTKKVRKQADRLSSSLTESITDAIVDSIDTVRERVRPRRRSRPPVALIAVGGALIGFGIAAVILGRRPEVRQRVTELSGRAPKLIGKIGGNGSNGHAFTNEEESALRKAVESAIFTQSSPPGEIRVDVEGRTVYLRGHVDDRGYVDQAVRKAQEVEGVAAVINLVSA